MTTGSYTKDTRVAVPYTVNGQYQGTLLVGKIETKTWNGGDRGSQKNSQKAPEAPRVYHTIVDPALRDQSLKDSYVAPPPPTPNELLAKRADVVFDKREAAAKLYYARKERNAAEKAARKSNRKSKFPQKSGAPARQAVAQSRKVLLPRPRVDKWEAPHAYTMSASITVNPLLGSVKLQQTSPYPSYTYAPYTQFGGIPSIPAAPTFNANDEISLVGRLRERVRGSDFNMAVALGESHQLVNMIGATAYRLASSYRCLKRGDLVEAASFLANGASSKVVRKKLLEDGRRLGSHKTWQGDRETLASNWLELQYGWLPLLGDVKGAAEQLAHRLELPFRKKVKAHLTKKLPASAFEDLSYYYADGYSIRSKQIIAYFSESQQESLPRLSGILDPELVLWELTPWSFVADWVLPIGDWLEARSFAQSLEGIFITTEVVRQRIGGRTNKVWFQAPGKPSMYVGSWGSGYRQVTSLTRTVSTSLQVPLPAVKPLSEALSVKHCLNALALLVGVAKGDFYKVGAHGFHIDDR